MLSLQNNYLKSLHTVLVMSLGLWAALGTSPVSALVGPTSTWPTSYNSFVCASKPSNDLVADSAGAKNERDVVGDATFPAAGWATNAT